MAFAACADEPKQEETNPFIGTWFGSGNFDGEFEQMKIVFDSNTVTLYQRGDGGAWNLYTSGSYTWSGSHCDAIDLGGFTGTISNGVLYIYDNMSMPFYKS